MSNISEVLPPHHKHCDRLFSDAEEAANRGDWSACDAALGRFADDLEAHLSAEESVLFPAFEAASGMRHGPTQMMRIEHGQMRELVGQMRAAQTARSTDDFAGAAETLLILMQQHNMKEENILYPMCDQSLAGELDRVAAELLNRLGGANGGGK